MKKTLLLLLFVSVFFASNIIGQVKTKTYEKEITDKEYSIIKFKGQKYNIDVPLEFINLKNNAKKRSDTNLYRFAFRKDVDINFLKTATMTKEAEAEYSIFSITIEAKKH